jgi:hypothetical protein
MCGHDEAPRGWDKDVARNCWQAMESARDPDELREALLTARDYEEDISRGIRMDCVEPASRKLPSKTSQSSTPPYPVIGEMLDMAKGGAIAFGTALSSLRDGARAGLHPDGLQSHIARVTDTHPKDGDVKQAPLVSGRTAKPERPKAMTQTPTGESVMNLDAKVELMNFGDVLDLVDALEQSDAEREQLLSAGALSGSREPSPTVSALSGVDPARGEALALCEQFVGQVLVARDVREQVPPSSTWQRLTHIPVQSIDAVVGCHVGEFAVDIDSSGDGWVRITAPVEGPVEVQYRVGMASTFDEVPEPLKAGIERMAGHLVSNPQGGPPAAVTALWRPYRRVRVS